MKNKDKYDNQDDALNAFYEMCYSRSCKFCPYVDTDWNSHRCVVAWLYDDAKSDKEVNNDKQE